MTQGPNLPKTSSTISPPKPDVAGNVEQYPMSRESSRRTEEIFVPRDSMNRIVRSEYDKNANYGVEARSHPSLYSREREVPRPRRMAIEYDNTRARNSDISAPHGPIPPPPGRFSSRYDDLAMEDTPRYTYRSWDDANYGSQIRNGSRERTRLERFQPAGEEWVSRPGQRERPKFLEDRDDEVIIRRNSSPEKRRDRGKRNEEINIREFERQRPSYRTRSGEEIVVREYERERPVFAKERDDRIIIRRDRPSRDKNEDITIREFEVERERPRIRERNQIVERRDPSWERLRFRRDGDDDEIRVRDREREMSRYAFEEDFSPVEIIENSRPQKDRSREPSYYESNRHELPEERPIRYEGREAGPLVLRNPRVEPQLAPLWEDKAERSDGDRTSSPSRRLNTTAPSDRLASHKTSTHDHADMDGDIGYTDKDIISSALRRFTTFNAQTEDDLMSPAGVGSPDIMNTAEISYRSSLRQAQRKLDELMAKQAQARKDEDFVTASDLQFYAIPDVRALVEELKVQDAKSKNGFKEAESGDELLLSPVVEREEFFGQDLSSRISKAKDSDTKDDAVSGMSKKKSTESSKGSTEIYRKGPNGTANQATAEAGIALKKIKSVDGLSNTYMEGIIRRSTTVTVEDDLSERSEDQRLHDNKIEAIDLYEYSTIS